MNAVTPKHATHTTIRSTPITWRHVAAAKCIDRASSKGSHHVPHPSRAYFQLRARGLLIQVQLMTRTSRGLRANAELPLALPLASGQSMPQVGFGTWGVKPRDVDTSLRAAVAAGYRLFDLAPVYNNQKAVGETLRVLQAEGAVTRDQLFLTSKVPPLDACAPGGVEASARQTLRDVHTSYLDLLLVHWPFCVRNGSPTWPPPLSYQLGYSREQLRETWRALEGLHASGAVRAIGLSNIGPHRLKALLRAPDLRVRPSVVQVELHPYNQQAELRAVCAAERIAVTAYSSLGSAARPDKYQDASHPVLLEEPALQRVATAHGATPAATALAWAVRRGVAVIPKSTHAERVRANLADTAALAPQLTRAELAAIDALERSHRFLTQARSAHLSLSL